MRTLLGALRSKTIWFNFITGLLAILALPEINILIPSSFLPSLAIINAVGNLFLRFLTNQPLSGKVNSVDYYDYRLRKT